MDSVSTALILSVITLIIYRLLTNYIRYVQIEKKIGVLGGEKPIPLFGNTLELLLAGRRNFFKTYLARNKRLGPVFRSWMGNIPLVHLMKAEHLEVVLKSQENLRKGTNYKFFIPFLGDGLIASSGPKWRVHRKLLTPTFHLSILDNFTEVFIEKSELLVQQLREKANGEFFDVYPFLSLENLDIVCETAMGYKINAMFGGDTEYVKAVYRATELIIKRTFNPFLHNDLIYSLTPNGRLAKQDMKTMNGFVRKVIKEKKEEKLRELKTNSETTDDDLGIKKRKAFLDLLLDMNIKDNSLSEEEIREEVDTFMAAGNDTTSVTVCWALFALANNPEIMKKAQNEIDTILNGEDRRFTQDDLNQMKYVDRVIKETLRYHTAVPTVIRAIDKPIKIADYDIPAGVEICMHVLELHKDPDYWTNPEVFDPDRFLPENSASRHPYAYIPFSAGPRNCLGQKFGLRSSKCSLASIIRHFNVKSLETPEEIETYFDIVVRPQKGMILAFEERKKH